MSSDLEHLLVSAWVQSERGKLLTRLAELEKKLIQAEQSAAEAIEAAQRDREAQRQQFASRGRDAKDLVKQLAVRAAEEEALRIRLQTKLEVSCSIT
jgi:hypothetical protein